MNRYRLTTPRLILRPISLGDVDDLWPYVSDPDICKYMSWHPHKDKTETKIFVERVISDMNENKSYTWTIFFHGEFCGIISLIGILRKHRALTYNRAELAYWLGKRFQHKGIMTEAGKRIIEFAFQELGVHRLIVSHVSQNDLSKRLIKRLNFKYIGTEREAFSKNGHWFDHNLYELLEYDL
jgi:RimJ/RimL family protein N-acetyltransferase